VKIGNLNESDSRAMLARNNFGRLGCVAEAEPYVVPINYFFNGQDIYIHSLPGKKINALRINGRACLQVDEIQDSYHWRSVIAYGDYEEITDEQLREKVLAELFRHVPHLTPVESKMTGGVYETIIFRLKVDKITGVGESW